MKSIIQYSMCRLAVLAAALAVNAPIALALVPRFDGGDGCPYCTGAFVDRRASRTAGSADADPSARPDLGAVPVAPAPGKTAPRAAVAAAISTAPQAVLPFVPPVKTAPPPVTQGADGYWRVSFQNLASFAFVPPALDSAPQPGSTRDVPSEIQALSGKRVCVSGFMLPVKMENGLVKECLLIRSPMMCCYGVVPAPNEWVVVKMKGPGAMTQMDTPLNFYGTLRVGHLYEEGTFAGIYELEGEKVSVN